MEQLGVRYLHRFAGRDDNTMGEGKVHILTEEDRRAMRKIERRAIWRVAIAGALSAGIAGAVEIMTRPDVTDWDWKWGDPVLTYWMILGAVTLLVTAIEIAYIYYESLRATYRLAETAGLDLFPDREIDQGIAMALARAALELPNPPDAELGVDHLKEASRFQLFAAAAIYKLKIMGTNILAKVLLRKLMGRAATRVWLEFVAVPITAAWNAIVCWLVLREVRVRALGPSMSMEFADMLLKDRAQISLEGQATMLQAVGSIIVRSADPHPNLIYLLKHLSDRLEHVDEVSDLDDPQAFLNKLSSLTPFEQGYVLKILELAVVLDGRIRKKERHILALAFARCDKPLELGEIKKLRKEFMKGLSITYRL